MTHDQLMAERHAKERDQAMAQRAAAKPEVRASRVSCGVQVVVIRPTPAMLDTMRNHGFALVTDLANTYERICATPAELTVVQDALRNFLGR